jgi:hypothetical protein
MNLTLIGTIIAALSAFGGTGSALLLLRGKWKIDKATLDKLDRDRREADEKRDKDRREADEIRDKERREQDEERVKDLREELGSLSRLSNTRFKAWRAAVADLDELWEYVDQHQPWDQEAYQKLRAHGIQISRPPRLNPRERRRYNADAPEAGAKEVIVDDDF